jgi:hypothetical protein
VATVNSALVHNRGGDRFMTIFVHFISTRATGCRGQLPSSVCLMFQPPDSVPSDSAPSDSVPSDSAPSRFARASLQLRLWDGSIPNCACGMDQFPVALVGWIDSLVELVGWINFPLRLWDGSNFQFFGREYKGVHRCGGTVLSLTLHNLILRFAIRYLRN